MNYTQVSIDSKLRKGLDDLRMFLEDLEQIKEEYTTLFKISQLEQKLENQGLTLEEAQLAVHDDLIGAERQDVVIH